MPIEDTITKNEKELIIERLMTISKTGRLSLGSLGTFSRDQMIEEINKNSPAGKQILRMHLRYLRSLKKTE